jgi:hypothetical protein
MCSIDSSHKITHRKSLSGRKSKNFRFSLQYTYSDSLIQGQSKRHILVPFVIILGLEALLFLKALFFDVPDKNENFSPKGSRCFSKFGVKIFDSFLKRFAPLLGDLLPSFLKMSNVPKMSNVSIPSFLKMSNVPI